jgi:hypothetical protein
MKPYRLADANPLEIPVCRIEKVPRDEAWLQIIHVLNDYHSARE